MASIPACVYGYFALGSVEMFFRALDLTVNVSGSNQLRLLNTIYCRYSDNQFDQSLPKMVASL